MARLCQGAVIFAAMSTFLLILSAVQASGLCPPGRPESECKNGRHDLTFRRTLISALLRRDFDLAELDDKTLERALNFLREEEERDEDGETEQEPKGSPLEREAQEEGDQLRSLLQHERDQEAERKKELMERNNDQEERLRELLEQILAE